MKERALSIRATLLLLFGMLTLLIAAQAGQSVYVEWRRLAKIESLANASRLSDTLFAATERLSVERDTAATLLRASERQTVESLRSRLDERRQQTDEAMRTTLQELERYSFAELVPLQKKIAAHFADIQQMREDIDLAMARPPQARDKTLAERWHNDTSALIVQTQDLWVGFVGYFTDIHPVVTQHLRYKHLLRIITDYTGRERAIIGRLIIENAAPAPKEFAELLQGQGIIALSWQINRLLADQSNLYPSVAPYYKEAQSHYQTLHGMVRDIFYMPGAQHGGAYPLSADLWLELSTQATESLDALKAVSVTETQRYIETLKDDAWRTIALQGLFLCFVLGFCVYSFQIIARRVLSPIQHMVEALLATMRGEKAHVRLPPRQGDEIGKLAQVLRAFQTNADALRQTSADLKHSEARLRAVVENALDGLITIDERGIVESFNPSCERIFGYRAQEVIGKNIKMLMPEPYHGEHDGYLARYLSTGDARIIGTAGREVSARRKDGSVFPIDLSISEFTLKDGRHFSGILRDISARKSAEQALKDYTQALERSNKELDDFAYIASHDLKEPLRGIHNHSRFLLEDNEKTLDEESVRKLNRLVYLSQRMERLVNDLLYFSRLGRQDLAIQRTDIGEVVHDIETTLEQFLEERNARIAVAGPLPAVVCDKPRITELFRNLVTNAVKYNDKPEKTVEIGFLKTQASPQGVPYRNVFYVRDNGKGIAPEFHDEIFRIFKRLQSNKDGGEDGTGVGLTFVKKIIERHGGKIWLESQPGQGTVFYFTLEGAGYDAIQAA